MKHTSLAKRDWVPLCLWICQTKLSGRHIQELAFSTITSEHFTFKDIEMMVP